MWITSIARFGQNETFMHIALIADAYPPLRSSGAVQLRDLAQEFVRQGRRVTVLVPAMNLEQPWTLELAEGVQVLRLSAFNTKDTGYVWRTVSEMLLSLMILRGLDKSPLRTVKWDALVWYSPTIFLGPLIGILKRRSACRSFLVLRDIFPEWAVDMGLLSRGPIYRFFKMVERYQYKVADTIGVQSTSNLAYLSTWAQRPGRRLEVLQNWLAPAADIGCSISIANTKLAGRTIFVYAGNMGVAQGMDMFIDLAAQLHQRNDIGFLFVGRGSHVSRLAADVMQRGLDNVIFHDEIDPAEIPGLFKQCHIGLVALDPRHKTHNVPGKFLTYIQAGLPVLARINAGNDLAELIEKEDVGTVYIGDDCTALTTAAIDLVADQDKLQTMSSNARDLAQRRFSVATAAKQIALALNNAATFQ